MEFIVQQKYFKTDKQTLDDLGIFGRPGASSIYSLFNKTFTQGGASALEEAFHYPFSDESAINRRSLILQYFMEKKIFFPFSDISFDAITHYLENRDERSKIATEKQNLGGFLTSLVSTDQQVLLLTKGVQALARLINVLREFVAVEYQKNDLPAVYQLELENIMRLLEDSALPQGQESLAELDAILRFRKFPEICRLLDHVYQIDMYCSVANVAREFGFCFPLALKSDVNEVVLEGVFHPLLSGAKVNDLRITRDSSIVFLTGANMAGKSTLMKSIGVALLLAHMGFPVAAKGMHFAVRDGLYTSINLSDNLSAGASHFYAEVLRIKKVATELSGGRRLFLIFDELFRGTNVKDAFDATVAITQAFATKANCMFLFSTHIMEAAEVLAEKVSNIQFVYLPTHMDGTKPIYTYTLKNGITTDRQGMIIIENEGILNLLNINAPNYPSNVYKDEFYS